MDKREQCKTITATISILQRRIKWHKLTNALLIFAILFSIGIAAPSTVHADTVPYSGITVSSGHSFPANVVIGPDNNLYVAEYYANRIIKMNKDGQDKATFATGLNQPIGMAFDSSGNMYVAEHAGKRVTKIDSSSNISTIKSFSVLLTGIAIDSHDKIFAVEYSSGKIYKMDLDGSNISTFVTGLQVHSIIGMAIDPDDNLYVSDRSGSKIIKVAPDGTVTDFATGIASATWITLGKDGFFYAAAGSRTIERMDTNGTRLRSFSTGGVSPWGLSVDADGYIYFGESSSTVIKIVGFASTASTTEVVLTLNHDISGTQADPAAFTFTGIASGPQVTDAVISGSSVILTLDNGISASDTSMKLNYTKTGADNLCLNGSGIEFNSFADLPVTNQVLDITSVSNIPVQYVPYGTALENVNLPGTVEIGLNPVSTTTAGVVWDTGTPPYNGNTAGTYNFRGTISTGGNITNTGNFTASLDVVVREALTKNIVSVSSIPDITVQNGTQVGSLGLPSIVDVSLDDASTTGAAVVWDGGTPAYNGSSAGTYIFTGTLDLEGRSDITNTDNRGASVSVTVLGRSVPTDNEDNSTSSESSNNAVAEVLINGKSYGMGTANTTLIGGRTYTSITVDDSKVQHLLESAVSGVIVSIPVSDAVMTADGVLNGQTVKNMENRNAILEVRTNSLSYTLPASAINIDSIASQFGKNVELKDIKVSVRISQPDAESVKLVQDIADKNKFQLVVKPAEFEIKFTEGGKTVQASKFNSYVERTIQIPDGISPSKITTGVVLNSDGTFTHVPTRIIQKDGKFYAKISSLTNSIYSVIYNEVTFADTSGHWAKDAINNMGARLIVSDVGNGNFSPDADITRAEFAAVIVKALGLTEVAGDSSFDDVEPSSLYAGYIKTAADYGIVNGYSVGTFGPNDKISREQAMTMIVRAMRITGLKPELKDSDVSLLLIKYSDGTGISGYAKTSAAACLKTGIITGKGDNMIAPKDNITRAEMAVIIQRVLQKAGLI